MLISVNTHENAIDISDGRNSFITLFCGVLPMLQPVLVSCFDRAAILQGQGSGAVVGTAQEGALIAFHVKVRAWVGVRDDSFAASCPIFDFTDVCRFARSRLPFQRSIGQCTLASLAVQPIFDVKQISFLLKLICLSLGRSLPSLHINLLTLRFFATIGAEVQ